jgi:hypothetical protein
MNASASRESAGAGVEGLDTPHPDWELDEGGSEELLWRSKGTCAAREAMEAEMEPFLSWIPALFKMASATS